MQYFRLILTLFLSLAFLSSTAAQEQKGFVGRTLDKILTPSRELDPNAVYQPKPRWTFAITGDLRQAGFTQNQEYTVGTMYRDPETGEMGFIELPVRISANLHSKMDRSVGIQAGFGNLSIAFSKKFHGEGFDNVYSFDYLSAGYALQVQFLNLSNPVEYSRIMAEEGNQYYKRLDGVTNNPGHLKSFIVDAFYAFNRRSFAYSAAYKGNLFQKHSAGSWMFGSKVIMGEYQIDPAEKLSELTGYQARQTSAQVSFGGGYSYNFVPFHRQPYAERDKGLRNLTINLTFLPMFTFFNQFTNTSYKYPEAGSDFEENEKTVMNGKLLVNYVARAGISYTYNLFTANLYVSNDSFSYKGLSKTVLIVKDELVNTSGRFFQGMVALRLGMRF
ncbi:MAG: DUF4421 family protein [Bacteroidales bacterium]|nr:DUF4421 family protein [Bacteroidales bacterium]